jgi:hypothetical protein
MQQLSSASLHMSRPVDLSLMICPTHDAAIGAMQPEKKKKSFQNNAMLPGPGQCVLSLPRLVGAPGATKDGGRSRVIHPSRGI